MNDIVAYKKNHLIKQDTNRIYLFKDIVSAEMLDENNIKYNVTLEFVTMSYVKHPIKCSLSKNFNADEEKSFFPDDYTKRERSYYLKFRIQNENNIFPYFFICQLLTNFKNIQIMGEIINTLDKQIYNLLKYQAIDGSYSIGLAISIGKLGKIFNDILNSSKPQDKTANTLFPKIQKILASRKDTLSKHLLLNIIETFFKHLENNHILKQCERHSCNKFFLYRSNKKYCNDRCRHLSADYRHYHNKKEKAYEK
ncbi:MAG: hypothetical protein E7018_00255 [Alphaproteobacteria bacterium]|nr:hypothetical protein [Alphaproteobacteria bacterium]